MKRKPYEFYTLCEKTEVEKDIFIKLDRKNKLKKKWIQKLLLCNA